MLYPDSHVVRYASERWLRQLLTHLELYLDRCGHLHRRHVHAPRAIGQASWRAGLTNTRTGKPQVVATMSLHSGLIEACDNYGIAISPSGPAWRSPRRGEDMRTK